MNAVKSKPLRDIRYFESEQPPTAGASMPSYAGKLFHPPKSIIALGQRIGMKCEELGLSIGRADHLYLCFIPTLGADEFAASDYAVEPWHRYALHGLPADFNTLSDEDKFARVREATFRVLEALAPDHAHALAQVRAGIGAHGEALRIVLKRKEAKRYAIRVEQTVPVHPQRTPVFVIVTDLASGVTKEAKVAEVRFYDEAPSLIDRLAIVKDVLTIHPRKSFRAELVAKPYEVPFQLDLARLFSN